MKTYMATQTRSKENGMWLTLRDVHSDVSHLRLLKCSEEKINRSTHRTLIQEIM